MIAHGLAVIDWGRKQPGACIRPPRLLLTNSDKAAGSNPFNSEKSPSSTLASHRLFYAMARCRADGDFLRIDPVRFLLAWLTNSRGLIQVGGNLA